MIFFIFGNNKLQIQEEIKKILIKNVFDEKIDLYGELLTPQNFAEITHTPNMFGQRILVQTDLEELSETESVKLLELSIKKADTTSIIFSIPKTLTKTSKILTAAKKVDKITIIEVKEEKDWTIFNFADTVFEINEKKAYELLQTLESKEEDPVKIHSILVAHLRNLARIKNQAALNVAPFVKSKLQKQANKYTENAILKI
ncbi:MAG TPA: hypothetical protein ENN92_00010, partial [candidate division WWE3 bacterium]|nr:hypothetical protein [candidate division WWE3 bacterium]